MLSLPSKDHPKQQTLNNNLQGKRSVPKQNRNGTIRRNRLPFAKPVSPAKPSEIIVQNIKTKSGEVKVRKYEKGVFLGKGGFARVYLVKSQDTNRQYAAKIIAKSSLTKRRAKNKLISEIKIHRSLDHKHIVKFISHFEDRENVYILLELCSNQTMMQLMKKKRRLPEAEARHYLLQAIDGVEYLHEQKVIHRDLKLGNMMLDSKNNIKIGDFGLAAKLEQKTDRRTTICGTPNYIAPEILNKHAHGFEVDVWSLGVIMYTLIVGRPAFETKDVKLTYKRIKENVYSFPERVHISPCAKDLISKMLSPDPSLRPVLSDIKEHEFFKPSLSRSLPSMRAPVISNQTRARTLSKRTALENIQSSMPKKRRPSPPKKSKTKTTKTTVTTTVTTKSKRKDVLSSKRTVNGKRPLAILPPISTKIKSSTVAPVSASSSESGKRARTTSREKTNTLDIVHDTLQQSFRVRKNKQSSTNTQEKENTDTTYNTQQCTGPSKVPDLWLSKWVDFSNKYGVGYSLNCGTTGAYFNDGTRITIAAEGVDFEYITADKPVRQRTQYSLETFPRDLAKKVNLLQHFQEYLAKQKDGIPPVLSSPTTTTTSSSSSSTEKDNNEEEDRSYDEFTFVEKWYRTKHAFIFLLSNGVVQVNFLDKTRLIITEGGHVITYTDKKQNTTVTRLSDIQNPSLVNRLSYTRDILVVHHTE